VLDEINEAAFDLDPREAICPECNLVHWIPAGRSFCAEAA
jgi:hypothetical protein